MNKIVGLAIAGAAVTGITATAIVKGRGGGSSGSPSFSSLLVGGSLPNTYSMRYGGTYGKYLVSSGESSRDWWNKKYESVKTQIPNSKGFKEVNKGYGADNTSLNKACEKAYVWNETQTGDDQQTQSDSPFDKSAIWKLCSDNKAQPKTISEYNFEPPEKSDTDKEKYKPDGGSGQAIGESQSNQLASINHPGNQWFWELKGEEFFSDPEIIKGNDFFGKHYQSNKSNNDKAKVIKEVCAKTYTQMEGSTDSTLAGHDDIFKWCSFRGEYQSPSG